MTAAKAAAHVSEDALGCRATVTTCATHASSQPHWPIATQPSSLWAHVKLCTWGRLGLSPTQQPNGIPGVQENKWYQKGSLCNHSKWSPAGGRIKQQQTLCYESSIHSKGSTPEGTYAHNGDYITWDRRLVSRLAPCLSMMRTHEDLARLHGPAHRPGSWSQLGSRWWSIK